MSPRSCSENGATPSEGGFTLIEVLVAISILAIVMTSVYGIFDGLHATKQRLDRDSAEYHRARVIFDRLGRELQGAYVRHSDPTTLLRSGVNEEGEAFLELTTTAVTPISAEGTGIAEVRYRLAQDPDTQTDERVLLRSERPRYDTGIGAGSGPMRLSPNIDRMQLRFYQRGRWQEQWESAQDGLPELVEISLLVKRDDGVEIPFTSSFELPVLSER